MKNRVNKETLYKKLKVLTTSIIFMLIVCTARYQYTEHENKQYFLPLEQQPIISVQARIDYANGKISKLVAQNQIENQLELLREYGDIQSWNYTVEDSSYVIRLNDDSVFTYYFK